MGFPTVTLKLSGVTSEPSLTVRVMVELPDRFWAGVKEARQLGAVPEKLTLGIRVEFEDVAESEAQVRVLSTSPMVTGRLLRAVLGAVV